MFNPYHRYKRPEPEYKTAKVVDIYEEKSGSFFLIFGGYEQVWYTVLEFTDGSRMTYRGRKGNIGDEFDVNINAHSLV